MIATKIVAVEDERIVALHMKQQLIKLGYNVAAVAASGEQALRDIAEFSPDVVLMDIHIEGDIDGIETASRIPPNLKIPVIYLTAYSEEATLERARATKPYGYLIKPYSERELHATIQMALERRNVEAALQVSEDRFRSIFGAISEGIFIVDAATGEFAEVNAAGEAMYGYVDGELVGRDILAIFAGDTEPTRLAINARMASAAGSSSPQRFDWLAKTKDGRQFWTEVSVRFTVIGGKNVVLAIVRDLTERKAMEEQLRQAQKMEAIGQLTGGVAHDFNNLLGVIIGNLDLLRGAHPDDPDLSELSGDALEAALSGADLTRRLLAFARRQPLQPQAIDLAVLINGVMRLIRRVLGENIKIELDLAEDLYVVADAAQLEAALTNLATNARDAMPNGGKLLITTASRHLDGDYAAANLDVIAGDYAMIEVTDTGAGMSPEVLSHIFEPFYTTKGREQGTGLGLSMVFGFFKQSGGHISVYSEVAAGTTFRLYLPHAGEVPLAKSPPTAISVSPSKGETVLIVEDSASLRRAAVRQLREFGYTVLEARNAAEALDRLAAARIDLLFTDVIMPGEMDGFRLACAAVDRWPGLKVVLTSGFPETRLAASLSATNFPLLTKPYRKSDLALALREALDGTAPIEPAT
jgi:PAS domain S-box-containing protein